MECRKPQYTDTEISLAKNIHKLTEKHIRLCDQQKGDSPEAIAILEKLNKMVYEFGLAQASKAAKQSD